MMKNKFIFLIFGLTLSCEAVVYDDRDAEYDRMPEIFALDNYDACMRRTDGLYCLLTLELSGDPNNELYKQIKDYSEHRVKRYNHTYLDRGICVPKTCKLHTNNTKLSVKDLAPILGRCLNQTIYNDFKLHADVLMIYYCDDMRKGKTDYDYLDWLAVTAVAGVLIFNVIGSLYDICFDKKTRNTKTEIDSHILTTFSIFQNWKHLCKDYKERSKSISLKGLTGLRIFALFSVIIVHVVYFLQSFGDKVHDFERLHDNPIYQICMYGFNVVQICFAMSGFLLSYNLVEYEDVSTISWIDIPKILLGRFVRLTPSYGFVLLLVVSWMRYIGSGPLWSMFIGGNIKACQKYYWHHIFYMNNYIYEDTCILPMWYVAADVQVFVVGVAAICLTKKRRMLVLSALFVVGILGTVVDILHRDLYPVAIVTPEFLRSFDNDTFRLSHIRGHNNLPCFVTGTIVGIFVFKWQKMGYKIQNKMLHYLSNLTPIALIAVFLSNEWLYNDRSEPTLITKLIFAVVFRMALSAVLAFWFISIVMKFDSPLCKILAWSGWVIPSRLAYSVYVIHMVIIIMLMGSRTTKENLTLIHFVTFYVGVTVISFVLATILYILIEAPCTSLLARTSMMKEFKKKINLKTE